MLVSGRVGFFFQNKMASPAETLPTGCPNSNQMGLSDNSVHRVSRGVTSVQFHLGRFMLKTPQMMDERERMRLLAQNRLN